MPNIIKRIKNKLLPKLKRHNFKKKLDCDLFSCLDTEELTYIAGIYNIDNKLSIGELCMKLSTVFQSCVDLRNDSLPRKGTYEPNPFFSEICEFNPENNNIKIVHLTDNPFEFENTEYITYTHTTKIDSSLFDDCNSSNIFLYIDLPRDNVDETLKKVTIYKLNELLKKTGDSVYKNVNIINILNTRRFELEYMLHISKNFRKIINIKKDDYDSHNVEIVDKSGSMIKPEDYKDDEVYYNFIRRNTELVSNKLIDQTFYKDIIFTPICSSGRLTQSTGTCWCNAIINSIILVPYLRKIIVNFLKTDKEAKSLKDLKYSAIKSATSLKYAIYILFNNLLLKQDRAQPVDGNFIADIASRVKSIVKTGDEKYYKKLKKEDYNRAIEYGNGGSSEASFTAFKIILKMFTEFTDLRDDVLMNIEEYRTQKEKEDTYLRHYYEYDECKKIGCPEEEELRDKWSNFNRGRPSQQTMNYNFTTLNVNEFINDIIVVYTDGKGQLIDEITINKVDYRLQSGKLKVFNGTHTVAGLICNDVRFIFDSNNILTFDNWVEFESENYKDAIKKDVFDVTPHDHVIKSIDYAIYVKKDLVVKKPVYRYY